MILQADEQVVSLHHVLTSACVVLNGRRPTQLLTEKGLNVCLTLSLVLTLLADGYDLGRQSVPRSAHQQADSYDFCPLNLWSVTLCAVTV